MSLKVNLRHLEERDLHLKGDLPVEELELGLTDKMMQAKKPVHYDLLVETVEPGILVRGKLDLTLECQCVRCLKTFEKHVIFEEWTVHLPLEGEEKVPVDNDRVDLTPFIREDMLLEFPQHPVCKPECGGLKKSKKSGRGEVEVETKTGPTAWNDLDKLNFKKV
jgi:uncharacterized protein